MVTSRRRAVAGALCAWLAAVSGGRAFAQEPIQATVDRAVVRDNESFTYVLRAEGAVRGDPEVAPLAAQFDILNTSSSRRIGVVNARATEVNEWQFQLMPKSAGEFTHTVVARRRSAIERRDRARAGTRSECDGCGRHLHGAQRESGDRLRAVASAVHAASCSWA